MQDWVKINFPRVYYWLVFIKHSLLYSSFYHKSYAQFGEDILTKHLFEEGYKGFFVDVGAHRPVQHSNTFYFYNKGWRGINIDATPGSMKLFRALRPKDINVEAAVSDKNESLTFFCFDQPLLNGFYDEAEVQKNVRERKYRLISKTKIETRTLTQILDQYLPPRQPIDFLSIDVEGLDLSVLRSIDWSRYRPKVILIEILHFDFRKLPQYEIYNFLSGQGYTFYSRTVNTLIFILQNSSPV